MKFIKPKFWDYQRPNLLSYILLPLTFPLIINNFFLSQKKIYKKNRNLKKFVKEKKKLVARKKHH